MEIQKPTHIIIYKYQVNTEGNTKGIHNHEGNIQEMWRKIRTYKVCMKANANVSKGNTK